MTSDFKIAVVATVYFPASHADVIVSRWLAPRATDREWGWPGPTTRIASMYIAQFPNGELMPHGLVAHDIGRAMAAQHGVPLYGTVREALTMGGDELAVDAVLLIGEHGDYPCNALGQQLYPRKELFDEIVAVFRETGRVVPLFCDKHLSWNPDWAREMIATVRALGIPFLAGSSLPWAGVEPDPEIPQGAGIEEYVGLFEASPEAYGFHSLEWMQSLIERRAGGETGVRAVRAHAGAGVWEAMGRGEWSKSLFEAALGAARRVADGDPRENCRGTGTAPHAASPIAFCLEHVDGLRSTHIMLQGHLSDFAMACRLRGEMRVRAGVSGITHGDPTNHYGHFATLDSVIEAMFRSGRPPVAPERTLLTTLATAACMRALQTPGVTLETPDLRIAYGG